MIKNFNEYLEIESEKEYFKDLMSFVNDEYSKYSCYPKYDDIFNAIKNLNIIDIKCVILGQDPYHNPGEAHGFAFSVLCNKIPPSLKNIYKEMEDDLGVLLMQNGDLTYLKDEGVLLLNTILTVRENKPLSHQNKGWEIFTDGIISLINESDKPVVFMLWGNNAIEKEALLNNPKHKILKTTHPSPLSAYRGFLGCRHFSKANEFLKLNNIKEINWTK